MTAASGKFVLRTGSELHSRLQALARSRHASLNEVCVDLLRQGTQGAGDSAKSHPFVESLQKIFKQNFIGLILFGSAARGEARKQSDQDFLIVLDSSIHLDRSLYALWDSKVSANTQDSPHFTHLPEDPNQVGSLWLEVALEGIVLNDLQQKLRPLLSQIRESILKGNYVRKISHGHPYWVRGNENAK